MPVAQSTRIRFFFFADSRTNQGSNPTRTKSLQAVFTENGRRDISQPSRKRLYQKWTNGQRIGKGKRTVEEVLGERVVGHELGDEQPLVPVAAVADQVGQAAVAQLPDPLGLLLRAKKKQSVQRGEFHPESGGACERQPMPSCCRA